MHATHWSSPTPSPETPVNILKHHLAMRIMPAAGSTCMVKPVIWVHLLYGLPSLSVFMADWITILWNWICIAPETSPFLEGSVTRSIVYSPYSPFFDIDSFESFTQLHVTLNSDKHDETNAHNYAPEAFWADFNGALSLRNRTSKQTLRGTKESGSASQSLAHFDLKGSHQTRNFPLNKSIWLQWCAILCSFQNATSQVLVKVIGPGQKCLDAVVVRGGDNPYFEILQAAQLDIRNINVDKCD